jgi:hypothetical protein
MSKFDSTDFMCSDEGHTAKVMLAYEELDKEEDAQTASIKDLDYKLEDMIREENARRVKLQARLHLESLRDLVAKYSAYLGDYKLSIQGCHIYGGSLMVNGVWWENLAESETICMDDENYGTYLSPDKMLQAHLFDHLERTLRSTDFIEWSFDLDGCTLN